MDNNSDEEDKELKIKEEPMGDICPKARSGRVIKPTKRDGEEDVKLKSENLMLTADKVMDKDLKLLHAPIEIQFKQEPKDEIDIETKPNTRNSNVCINVNVLFSFVCNTYYFLIHSMTEFNSFQKKVNKNNVIKIRIKDEDASSSEEEKQWVTTKEKLLKRLGKKNDTTRYVYLYNILM